MALANTNEKAVCHYSATPGVAFGYMTGTLTASASGLSQSASLSGLVNGMTYSYFIRCQDISGNIDASDYSVSFSIAAPADPVVLPPGNLKINSMKVSQ